MMGTSTIQSDNNTSPNIQCNENKLYTNAITPVGIERQNWRNTFTFKDAKHKCHSIHDNFTVAVLQSGGLLCTLGAIRAGWSPVWGTEICPKHVNAPTNCQHVRGIKDCIYNLQQRMWHDLTGTTCYGNTFVNVTQYRNLPKPMYVTVSPECTDFCIAGKQVGSDGLTGWQLPDIAIVLLEIEPLMLRIENSSNAPQVLNGKDVLTLKTRLSSKYVLHIYPEVHSYDYGDCVHSIRWICIGCHHRMGNYAYNYNFASAVEAPTPPYCVRDIADPEHMVPLSYWRPATDTDRRVNYKTPEPGQVHRLASAGVGMGIPNMVNTVSSWDGALPRPTTYGGAGRHPRLLWKDTMNNSIGPTRVSTIHERIKGMSAPPDTVQYYSQFSPAIEFLKRNIGNGVSCMLATAIDASVMAHVRTFMGTYVQGIPAQLSDTSLYANQMTALISAELESGSNMSVDQIFALYTQMACEKGNAECHYTDNNLSCEVRGKSQRDTFPMIRSAMIDTGANRTFLYCNVEPWMHHAYPSKLTIQVADAATSMKGNKDGNILILVLDQPNDKQSHGEGSHNANAMGTKLELTATTVSGLHRELISVDEHYVNGFNILLKQPGYEDGIPQLYKEATASTPEVKIPCRYDKSKGGFWIDYIPVPLVNSYLTNSHSMNATATAHVAKAHVDDNATNILLHKHLHDMNPSQTGPPAEYLNRRDALKQAQAMAQKEEVIEVFHARHIEEREIRGVKAGLRKKKRAMSQQEFHEQHMHMGTSPNCKICILAGGTLRRILRKVDPHKETRVAYTFHMDTLTWSHRGFCGSKYEIHMVCEATSWPDSLFLFSKADSLSAIESWIIQMRLDPLFKGMPYEPVQRIVLDNAGEWDLEHVAFQKMAAALSVQLSYTSKDRKESNSRAERAIGIKEPKVKAALLQNNLPPVWGITVSRMVNWILARFPPQTHDITNPPDGDKQLPLEAITRGRISRRMIYNQIYYFLSVGTPALVHDASTIGSKLPDFDINANVAADCKARWMVAIRMYGDQVVFWDPRTNDTCRSKSYTAFKLRAGINFGQLLGCNMPAATLKSRPREGDWREKIVIQLPEMVQLMNTAEHPQGEPVQQVISKHNLNTEYPSSLAKVNCSKPCEDGGSVVVTDSNGAKLQLDPATGWLLPPAGGSKLTTPECMEKLDHTKVTEGSRPKRTSVKTTIPIHHNQLSVETLKPCHVNLTNGPPKALWDRAEAAMALEKGYTTGMADTFTRVCKELLPWEQHASYKIWCTKVHTNQYGGKLQSHDLPTERNNHGFVPKLAPKWFFPYPTGSTWREIKSNINKDFSYENDKYVQALYAEVCLDVSHAPVENGVMQLSSQSTSMQAAYAYTTLAQRQSQVHRRRAHPKAKKQNRGPPHSPWPNSVKQAQESSKPEAWDRAIKAELDKLTNRGVFMHDQTMADIRAYGINTKVVPLGLYLTEKYDENGNLLREKARAAVKGHKGNMQKGVHYFETYAATPQPETARILVCIAVQFNWQRRAWDVELAYAWADIPVNERLALAYPKGCERYHPTTGEPLYIILMKNLYGDPAAGRRWSIHRDNKILSEFQTRDLSANEVWTVKRTIMDPCLFHITLKVRSQKVKHRMYVSIHTDDLDAVGSSAYILDEFYVKANSLWTLHVANENFMLGIQRTPKYGGQGILESVTCTQSAFVKGAVEAYRNELPTKVVDTPYPAKCSLTKDTVVDQSEIDLYTKKGYARVVGLLMWAVRHGFDECKFGMSILCSVASKPGKRAWTNAMHMLSWMEVNKDRGVRFNNKGNTSPVIFADASDKALYSCGKRQAGYAIMWMDGPLATHSHRQIHVGGSIEHCEYMAICAAIKKVVWLTQLLDELQVAYEKPLRVFGDNVQANRLAMENIITPGNQYIQIQYHLVKEKVQEGLITVSWVDTNLNISDMYTKALPRVTCVNLMANLLGFGDGINSLVKQILSMDPTCKPR